MKTPTISHIEPATASILRALYTLSTPKLVETSSNYTTRWSPVGFSAVAGYTKLPNEHVRAILKALHKAKVIEFRTSPRHPLGRAIPF